MAGRPRKDFSVQLINETYHKAILDTFHRAFYVKGKITIPNGTDVEQISKRIEAIAEEWLSIRSERHIVDVQCSEYIDKRAIHTHINYILTFVKKDVNKEEISQKILTLITKIGAFL